MECIDKNFMIETYFKNNENVLIELSLDDNNNVKKALFNNTLVYDLDSNVNIIRQKINPTQELLLCKFLDSVKDWKEKETKKFYYHQKNDKGLYLNEVVLYKCRTKNNKKIVEGYQKKVIYSFNIDLLVNSMFKSSILFLIVHGNNIVYSCCNDKRLLEKINDFTELSLITDFLSKEVYEENVNIINQLIKKNGILVMKVKGSDLYHKIKFGDINMDEECFYISIEDYTVTRKNYLKVQELENKIMTDTLTGLNTRSFGLRACQKQEIGFFSIMDLDKFKLINDTFGHPIGDKVLIVFSSIMKSFFDDNYIKMRFGGDEFVIIGIEKKSPEMIQELFCQFYNKVKENEFLKILNLEFSVGVEINTENLGFEELYVAADKKLYIAKKIKGFMVTI